MIDPRPLDFFIEDRKLRLYLLNPVSRDGGAKAAKFLRHNFTPATLRDALVEQARTGRVERRRETRFGSIIEIAEPTMTPLNTYLDIPSVWEIRPATPSVARLVTVIFR